MWGVNPEDFIWQVGAVKSEIDLDSPVKRKVQKTSKFEAILKYLII